MLQHAVDGCPADLRKYWVRCSYHRSGPRCSPIRSNFTSSSIAAQFTRAVSCRCGFGISPRLCCAASIETPIPLRMSGQRLPQRSYTELSHCHCPSNYGMEAIMLYRRKPVNGGVNSIHASVRQTGGSNTMY